MVKVKVQRIKEDVALPRYAHEGDAGMDIFAAESVTIQPMERVLVSTGIKLEIPHGYECQVRPKSGLALNHGITLTNTPGTIDSGYRGEIRVIMMNLGKEPYKVEAHQKIAQLVFSKFESAELDETAELNGSNRGAGGFGSTGVQKGEEHEQRHKL